MKEKIPQIKKNNSSDRRFVAKKEDNNKTTFYHGDHLGSTTFVTNQAGNITEEEFYLPFGDIYLLFLL